MAADKEHERRLAAENRKARFNYEVLDVFEAGIVLSGTEIKSLRGGKANIADSYAATAGTDMVLYNAYIPEYLQANRFNHETRRPRRLLMHRKEINKLLSATERDGLTIVPLDIHFNDKGRAKVKLALARGKKLHDKRETEKDRDWKREQGRLLKARD
ncbi:MAG: SsrA-binding protein SmpB [Ancalomicrobiaceae bacterium]|nr:SsrA-binding protein SmpB [Ancalomicrobiaceae bacterium]